MARTTAEIQATMDTEQAAQPALSTLNSTSQTAIYTLWKYIVSKCQNVLEQLWDEKKTELENIIFQGITPSIYWVRAKTFEFQYDATTPQVIELIDLIPRYRVIDTTKRIVTRAAVNTGAGYGVVNVAKNEPPEKMTAPELAALQDYFTAAGDGTTQAIGIGYAGQSISFDSYDPDRIYIEGEIFYSGQYSATFPSDAILKIETYISNLDINGVFRVSQMINALAELDGFNSIDIVEMVARPATTGFGGGTVLYLASAGSSSAAYLSTAGYMIGEDTVGETFLDKITFTAV